jgi:hypothetical protein
MWTVINAEQGIKFRLLKVQTITSFNKELIHSEEGNSDGRSVQKSKLYKLLEWCYII